YSSHFHGPSEGGEIHLVIVDNGRSSLLDRPWLRKSLACIRCGACLNTCPVFRRSGGHSYGYTIPGPIGSSLAAGRDLERHYTLPFACTLCASCRDVCPVKVDLDSQLYAWRREAVETGALPLKKRLIFRMMGKILGSPGLYRVFGWLGRKSLVRLPGFIVYNRFNVWGRQRDLPNPPNESFRQWYGRQKRRDHES
ncbi:MAG: lactate utilization protein, partial [Proteobacteria bacterium]|nr:lactate utilization protein [Pseudomonadota bacterium]